MNWMDELKEAEERLRVYGVSIASWTYGVNYWNPEISDLHIKLTIQNYDDNFRKDIKKIVT